MTPINLDESPNIRGHLASFAVQAEERRLEAVKLIRGERSMNAMQPTRRMEYQTGRNIGISKFEMRDALGRIWEVIAKPPPITTDTELLEGDTLHRFFL
jgi:hypothetical protein